MPPDVTFCYYSDWAKYRPGNGKFTVSDINPQLLTHIAYAFITLREDGTVSDPEDPESLRSLVGLKKTNSKLKILISLGGWNDSGPNGSAKYSRIAASPQKRSALKKSVVQLLDKYNLDGFDLDWEYPNQYGGSPEDKVNFPVLLQELKEALKGRVLTAAIGASKYTIDTSYNISEITSHVDIINLMTYDYHNYQEGHVGHNTPLYPKSGDTLCIDTSVKYLKTKSPDMKIFNLGLATYGKTYTMIGHFNFNNQVSGPGQPGPYTRSAGTFGYNEVAEFCGNWQYFWDDSQKVPYRVQETQVVAYDDPKSIQLKTRYAMDMGLGGVMVWSLDTDDFRNGYPLLKAARNF